MFHHFAAVEMMLQSCQSHRFVRLQNTGSVAAECCGCYVSFCPRSCIPCCSALEKERSAQIPAMEKQEAAALKQDHPAEDNVAPLPELNLSRTRFAKGRSDSIVPTAGKEGSIIVPHLYKGQSIAVFTSGGDAPGLQFCFFAFCSLSTT